MGMGQKNKQMGVITNKNISNRAKIVSISIPGIRMAIPHKLL